MLTSGVYKHRVTKFCTVHCYFPDLSVELASCHPMAPGILSWHLDMWKICGKLLSIFIDSKERLVKVAFYSCVTEHIIPTFSYRSVFRSDKYFARKSSKKRAEMHVKPSCKESAFLFRFTENWKVPRNFSNIPQCNIS
jgi:hypothetical protein